MPSEQFLHLSFERQREILNSCLREFAEQGYDAASTNRMVERAGMSKGVLFKYFKDKENLFLYLCRTAVGHAADALKVDNLGHFHDLFELLKHVARRKVAFYKEHPLMYRLFLRITRSPEHPVYAKVVTAFSEIAEAYTADIVRLFPSNLLKPGVNLEQAMSAVLWISEGIQNKYLAVAPAGADHEVYDEFCQQLVTEMDHYFELLKHGIYKGDRQA